jgi:hypothetical protein
MPQTSKIVDFFSYYFNLESLFFDKFPCDGRLATQTEEVDSLAEAGDIDAEVVVRDLVGIHHLSERV